MSAETARWAVLSGAVTGAFVAVAMVLAFGIFDIQCRDQGASTEWNAVAQVCSTPQPNVD